VPPNIRPEMRRYYLIMNIVAFSSAVGHGAFIPLFLWLGLPTLVYYNFASVGSFLVANRINRAGWHKTAVTIMVTEFTLHAWLAMKLAGPAYGFQVYILGWGLLPFIAPSGDRWFKLAIFTASTANVVLLLQLAGDPDTFSHLPGGRLAAFWVSTVNYTFHSACLAFCFFHFRNMVDSAEAAEHTAHEQSESLLLAILPRDIAERLKAGVEAVAEKFDCATVLFLDIAGFTPWAATRSAEEVVTMLNKVFSRLDAEAFRLGLEKIKTIGDAYMVASGVPVRREDHAVAVGKFALAVQEVLADVAQDIHMPLEVRMGIDSGPAVAGVIGKSKFAYDLWGDMVNTAARMEAHGVPGRIHTTSRFRDLTCSHFLFEPRGEIEIKGKGVMSTWFLNAVRPPDGEASPAAVGNLAA
jgi:guanylate cyclase